MPTIDGEETAEVAAVPVQKAKPKVERTQSAAPAPNPSSEAPSSDGAPVMTNTGEDAAPIAEQNDLSPVAIAENGQNSPVVADTAAPAQESAQSNVDWDVAGGIAGALGLAGLGGILYARRRKPIAKKGDAYDTRIVAPVLSTGAVVSEEPTPAIVYANSRTQGWVHTPRNATVAQRDFSGSRSYMDRVDDGPIAENPFLTRKNRLRRARFLDARSVNSNDTSAPSTNQPVSVQVHREYEPA